MAASKLRTAINALGSVVRSPRVLQLERKNFGRICASPGFCFSDNYAVQRRSLATAVAASQEEPAMFCFQCEQTKGRKGCTTVGVCGKTPQVAHLQDLLVYILHGIGIYGNRIRKFGIPIDPSISTFIYSALFSTLTNVNFDDERFSGPLGYISEALNTRNYLRKIYLDECTERGQKPEVLPGPADYDPPEGALGSTDILEAEGKKFGVKGNEEIYGADLNGVRQMIIYGLKGMAAYARHADILGEGSVEIADFTLDILDFLIDGPEDMRHDLAHNLGLALKVGEMNLKGLELLDKGHKLKFGNPTPHEVSTAPVPGKAILVSGHDIQDLHKILELTEGTEINVYTHGELLPAHGYPKLQEFKHFVGHFGGAWQNQKFEFPTFPGPIVITTNCLVEPLKSYKNRIFTLNECGFSGVPHLDINKPNAFDPVLKIANEMRGFTETSAKASNNKVLTIGFGHDAILANADKVIEAVQTGGLKRVFVVGGCDGSENKRSYYTSIVDNLPKETIVLTLGCAKYRFNSHDLGMLGDSGIPRLLDMGQCNDAYGAVVVASALAKAFNTDVNSLPLSIALSWFEQKAVAVLLSLLHLGIKNIRVGPVLPAFITPTVLDILVEKFNIQPTDNRHPLDDLHLMMGNESKK
ncbi:unnamed protein product [Owenia fusiformis]|uniref:Uncharacterized protein n=1 Tax=Owenia fusiformis TaxID=6347 RepID=A0A8J1XPW6_OWEFU|nr:unnamed protein product [Owenia fusiformis]